MDGVELLNQLNTMNKELNRSLNSLAKLGKEYAGTERDYRKALRKSYLIERNKGTPVTIISDLCRGEDEIADLKYDRDCADTMYKACLEGIQILKLQLRLVETQIDREWGRRGNG